MSDAVFDTRLDARSLVEASAGTGKTFALAGLFARAVIVERLEVPRILAVTYTIAATQELHARVRRRLQQAADLADAWHADAAPPEDDDPERALLHRLLAEALTAEPREPLQALRLRLARAVRAMDLAAISTIHGFCSRVLAEHALDTGQALTAGEIETATAAARRHLAVDLWRDASSDTGGADFLRRGFGDLDGLANALTVLLAPERLLPPAPTQDPPDPRPAVDAAWSNLCEAYRADGMSARDAVLAAIEGKLLHGGQYRPEHVAAVWAWLQAHAGGAAPGALHEKLAKYTPSALTAGTSARRAGSTPESPLFAAVDAFIAAHAQIAVWREAGELLRLHALRDAAWVRDRARKRNFGLRGYDDLIGAVHAAAVDPTTGPALSQALRAQFPLVLVDEFQDTDARQWRIFERLFGDGGLVLVGDPKQAIYRFRGGDVHSYLLAARDALAGPPLSRNFRSRPCVLAAVNALFARARAPALGEGIDFKPVSPGGKVGDEDFTLDTAPAPAIGFHVVQQITGERGSKPKDRNKDESIAEAAALCAETIALRLSQARDGHALRRDTDGMRPIAPRDCAVLVRTHEEAFKVREALARCGVPAVSGGRRSLFQTDEAREALTLLLALRAVGDDRRLRAALATRLFGRDAAAIAALDEDGDALRRWQLRFEGWRERWERHGPQAVLTQVVAESTARLLAAVDGERCVTNFLHLAERMQEAGAHSLGTQGQIDWLRAAIAAADADDEAQQLRLESDAGRVQILTLHASKGLEFSLVFLPFVGIGRGREKPKDFAMYSQAQQRVRQWKTDCEHPGAPSWKRACELHVAEERAEDMRLLYVGLTRARHALWLCCGALAYHGNTALSRLLGGSAPGQTLRAVLGANATFQDGLPADPPRRLEPMPPDPVPPPRQAHRRLPRDWWIHSFSQLHRQQAQGATALFEEAPTDDERTIAAALPVTPPDPRFAGPRFGNALHHALERADFAAWRGHDGSAPPPRQRALLAEALRSQGYREADADDGVRALAPLLARTLNARLPEGVHLCELPGAARIAELEFHFGLEGVTAGALLDCLHAHDIALARRDFGAWSTLAGLMTGRIDLTYRHDGRVYVLDYKSNLLPDYEAATLAQAMATHEYDLQALLYAIAAHRWLRLRLGAEYDFDRHFGGVRYLFCRGLEPADPVRGVVVPRITRALVETVDALLGSSQHTLPPRESAA